MVSLLRTRYVWSCCIPKKILHYSPSAEDWTFAADGRMKKRQMSGNDVRISESERWFVDGATDDDVDKVNITEEHW